MTHYPDEPCQGCGKLTWFNSKSQRRGNVTCRGCRLDARMKPCEGCGKPIKRGYDKTCPYRSCPDCRARKEPIGTCAYCGGRYEKLDQRSKYCSRSCRSRSRATEPKCPKGKGHAARAAHYGVEYEQVRKLTVYERDQWRCGICGLGVDKRLAYPNPMSASLDHILAMSQGGGHTYVNCQCSHLRCNIEKRDGVATLKL